MMRCPMHGVRCLVLVTCMRVYGQGCVAGVCVQRSVPPRPRRVVPHLGALQQPAAPHADDLEPVFAISLQWSAAFE